MAERGVLRADKAGLESVAAMVVTVCTERVTVVVVLIYKSVLLPCYHGTAAREGGGGGGGEEERKNNVVCVSGREGVRVVGG